MARLIKTNLEMRSVRESSAVSICSIAGASTGASGKKSPTFCHVRGDKIVSPPEKIKVAANKMISSSTNFLKVKKVCFFLDFFFVPERYPERSLLCFLKSVTFRLSCQAF